MPCVMGTGATLITLYLGWVLFVALGDRVILLLPFLFCGYHMIAFYVWMRRRGWL
jgi:hypothetical protein